MIHVFVLVLVLVFVLVFMLLRILFRVFGGHLMRSYLKTILDPINELPLPSLPPLRIPRTTLL